MLNIEKLTSQFEKANPNIKVVYDTLSEDNERSAVETDITTHANQFNVAMISNQETPTWAKNGWLTNLKPVLSADKSYDYSDLISNVVNGLSYNGGVYAAPFYAESSMIMYRKSLFQAAGLTMPQDPTWQQIASFAQKLNNKKTGTAGICLRGQVGWGENLAALIPVINAGGGSWFNMKWEPQLTSPATEQAVKFYVNLVRNYGESGASNDGFAECENYYGQGKAAMWYDATSAAGPIFQTYPKVAADTGYAFAPSGSSTGATGERAPWLYSWSLVVPKGVPNASAAEKYVEWATGPQYIKWSASKVGWANIDPGTRYSTYALPQYQKAAPFAPLVLKAIETANEEKPTTMQVPYTGDEFIVGSWFISLGTEVSQQISAAIAGTESVDQALKTSQTDAESTMRSNGLLK
jgi:sorbitol/mannitol transport system substrate-binding protein